MGVSIFNTGYDLQDQIDAAESAIAIVSIGSTHAAITSGQYVYVREHGTLAEGLYRATANIAANGTLSSSNVTAVSGGGLNALNSNITKITLPTKITCSSQSDFETKANTLAGTLSNGEIASVAFGFPSGMIFNGTSAWGYINRYSATRWNMILTSYDDSTYVVNIQYNNGAFKYTDLNSKTDIKTKYLDDTSKSVVQLLTSDFSTMGVRETRNYSIHSNDGNAFGHFTKYTDTYGTGLFSTYYDDGSAFFVRCVNNVWSRIELAFNSTLTTKTIRGYIEPTFSSGEASVSIATILSDAGKTDFSHCIAMLDSSNSLSRNRYVVSCARTGVATLKILLADASFDGTLGITLCIYA